MKSAPDPRRAVPVDSITRRTFLGATVTVVSTPVERRPAYHSRFLAHVDSIDTLALRRIAGNGPIVGMRVQFLRYDGDLPHVVYSLDLAPEILGGGLYVSGRSFESWRVITVGEPVSCASFRWRSCVQVDHMVGALPWNKDASQVVAHVT
jgi:hypothetical protein